VRSSAIERREETRRLAGELRLVETGRAEESDPAQRLAHTEIVERAAEIDRCHMPLAIGLGVERRAEALRISTSSRNLNGVTATSAGP
jgi:anaerobic glycerol-3-phosphate dehydrogenase